MFYRIKISHVHAHIHAYTKDLRCRKHVFYILQHILKKNLVEKKYKNLFQDKREGGRKRDKGAIFIFKIGKQISNLGRLDSVTLNFAIFFCKEPESLLKLVHIPIPLPV